MLEHSVSLGLQSTGIVETSTDQLRIEFQVYQDLLDTQPPLIRSFLKSQADLLADALIKSSATIRFSLPDQVSVQGIREVAETVTIPTANRQQELGGFFNQLVRKDARAALRTRLMELEHSSLVAVSTSAVLLRHALVIHLVHDLLPAGKTVLYKAMDGDEIPSIPVQREIRTGHKSARSGLDSLSESESKQMKNEARNPFVEAARWFYLPQWVCVDDKGHLLVGNINEAEAQISSMQNYFGILATAFEIAPYIGADEDYQRKRYGIQGQLLNQGRALAGYEIQEIVQKIKRRAESRDLNQGLSLSLPFFNDQTLSLEMLNFEVIPNGRVMFVPAFIVLAVRAQAAKVAQEMRFNKSTRRHLLMQLSELEQAFLR